MKQTFNSNSWLPRERPRCSRSFTDEFFGWSEGGSGWLVSVCLPVCSPSGKEQTYFFSHPERLSPNTQLQIELAVQLSSLTDHSCWLGMDMGFPGGSAGKESACNAGALSSIPGSGKSPGGGNGNPLQYSCSDNSMDRGTWRATIHGVTKSQTRLSD